MSIYSSIVRKSLLKNTATFSHRSVPSDNIANIDEAC